MNDAQERLAAIRAMTEAALAGDLTGDPAFDALGLVARECAIPPRYPRDLVEGFAMDAAGFRPADEAELLTYCYHVAGVVGVMMAIVMGVPPEDEPTLARANDLGLAFQLANIARDIREDAEARRCYIPATWLSEFGLPAPPQHPSPTPRHPGLEPGSTSPSVAPEKRWMPDQVRHDGEGLMSPKNRPALAQIATRLAERAGAYEASARQGAAKLPFRARWAVLAAAGIYGDIAREVARRGERAWDERVFTSGWAKLAWVIRALGQARRDRARLSSPAG